MLAEEVEHSEVTVFLDGAGESKNAVPKDSVRWFEGTAPSVFLGRPSARFGSIGTRTKFVTLVGTGRTKLKLF